MNPGCRAQDQLNTSGPTAPYVKAREINLCTCWVIGESNSGPFARAASGLTTGPPRHLNLSIQRASAICVFVTADDVLPSVLRRRGLRCGTSIETMRLLTIERQQLPVGGSPLPQRLLPSSGGASYIAMTGRVAVANLRSLSIQIPTFHQCHKFKTLLYKHKQFANGRGSPIFFYISTDNF